MLVEPDISKEEFGGILEGMELLLHLLKNVPHAEPRDIARMLRAGLDKIEASGIKRVVDANDAATDAHDHYYAQVAQRHGFITQWAVYEAGPVNMGNVPYVLASEMLYIDEAGNSHGPVKLEDTPSWLMLWRAAESLIVQSRNASDKTIVGFYDEGTLLKVRVST